MSLTRSKAVLELGKRLVEQLDSDDDLLASWMAHYVAERIEAVERASPEDRAAAEDACAKAILELWQYRNSLPDHLRPLRDLESIERTLALLDLANTDFRHYPRALREAATANAKDHAKQWLDLALNLDYSARILIQFALRTAGHRAAVKTQPWVELASQAGVDEGVDRDTVEFILGPDEESGEGEDERRAAVLERVSQLENFAELATAVAEELRTELGIDDGE